MPERRPMVLEPLRRTEEQATEIYTSDLLFVGIRKLDESAAKLLAERLARAKARIIRRRADHV